jgi:hypothetical protein
MLLCCDREILTPAALNPLTGSPVFCEGFFTEYNHVHRHSGIGWHTPASVHFGTAGAISGMSFYLHRRVIHFECGARRSVRHAEAGCHRPDQAGDSTWALRTAARSIASRSGSR